MQQDGQGQQRPLAGPQLVAILIENLVVCRLGPAHERQRINRQRLIPKIVAIPIAQISAQEFRNTVQRAPRHGDSVFPGQRQGKSAIGGSPKIRGSFARPIPQATG